MSWLSTPSPLWWLGAALWAALIFWLSSSPDAQGGGDLIDLVPYGDMLAHGAAFGLLAVFVYLASGHLGLALALTSLYGLSDEIHQAFVPGRSAEIFDWVADTVGALAGLLLVRNITRDPCRAGKPLQ